MHNRRKPNALALPIVFAVLVMGSAAVSGCGASATLDPIARAAEVSSQQEGARVLLTTQLSSPSLPDGSLSFTANGYLDERDHSGELSIDLSKLPGASAPSSGAARTMQMLFQYYDERQIGR